MLGLVLFRRFLENRLGLNISDLVSFARLTPGLLGPRSKSTCLIPLCSLLDLQLDVLNLSKVLHLTLLVLLGLVEVNVLTEHDLALLRLSLLLLHDLLLVQLVQIVLLLNLETLDEHGDLGAGDVALLRPLLGHNGEIAIHGSGELVGGGNTESNT